MSDKRAPAAQSTSADKPAIDWKEIRRRMEKVRAVIEQGWVPGPEEERKVLGQRARALAKEPEKEAAGEEMEIIEFLLARERYGIEISYVREAYHLSDLVPVPCTPVFVSGIINVRGRIVSVIDLKKFFELPEKGLGDLNRVIILRSEEMEFGILADAILDVRKIPVKGLQPSLPTLGGVREEYLRGIARDGTVILDAARLLADRKLVVNEQA
ncbi:MAG: chemotaxis protein CheW [Nitrospiraceae bacterium]|nr:chemotaxis protein CheW [Nitrospiraceae bacterium]